MLRLSLALAVLVLLLAIPAAAQADASRGRPDVELDRLDFPAEVAGAHYFKQRLRTILKRQVRRADWGAGRGARIQYRFTVTELVLQNDGEVLRVRCTAIGKLPGGKSAKSNLAFGGSPNQRNKLVERVLEIVARGVITRLAELERIRRGDLPQSRVRAPPTQ